MSYWNERKRQRLQKQHDQFIMFLGFMSVIALGILFGVAAIEAYAIITGGEGLTSCR